MKTAALMVTTASGPKKIGSVILAGAKLTVTVQPEYQLLRKNLLQQPISIKGGAPLTATRNPKEWFEALPAAYHGSYFWVETK